MGSEDLVLETLAHREPSRVPVDYWGTREVDTMLCRHFGVGNKDEMLKRMGIDLRYVFPVYTGPKLRGMPMEVVKTFGVFAEKLLRQGWEAMSILFSVP